MQFPLFCAFFVAIFGATLGDLIGREQSAGAKGILLCEGKPIAGVKVKLYDDDRGIDADDIMGQTKTDSKGYFEVEGHTSEITTIDPKINIYHNCADGLKPCDRKVTIMLKDDYVFSGKKPDKLYDIGRLELEGKIKGEERDCLN